MDRDDYLCALGAIAAALAILGLALWFGFGDRWFSFYGIATLALAAILPLGWAILKRSREQGYKRWPVLVVMGPILFASLVQIGYWMAFFGSGPQGLGLAAARAMVMPLLAPWLPLVGILAATLMLWLIGRGAVKR